jgi:chitin synthase
LTIVTGAPLVSALVLAFKGLDQLVKDSKGSLYLGDFFSDVIFWNIVLSLAATLGLYVFASLIFVS